jgi:hypothetical protein
MDERLNFGGLMPLQRLAIGRQRKAMELEGICTSIEKQVCDLSVHRDALIEELSGLQRSLKEYEKKEEEDRKASKKITAQMAKVQWAAQQAGAADSKITKSERKGSEDQGDSERMLIFML